MEGFWGGWKFLGIFREGYGCSSFYIKCNCEAQLDEPYTQPDDKAWWRALLMNATNTCASFHSCGSCQLTGSCHLPSNSIITYSRRQKSFVVLASTHLSSSISPPALCSLRSQIAPSTFLKDGTHTMARLNQKAWLILIKGDTSRGLYSSAQLFFQ